MRADRRRVRDRRGFTLIEVLVALVIVAFGMGAVLAALSSAAGNISALREKTLAQWIAMNQVATTRLNLQQPTTGTTQGDVKGFGNGDWHWQQDVESFGEVPGMLQITVQVRRIIQSSDSAGGSARSSGSQGATGSTDPKAQNWLATVMGFRGDAIAASSGETPDWTGAAFGAGAAGGNGNVANPGTSSGANAGSSSGSTGTPGSSSSSGSSDTLGRSSSGGG